MSQWDFGPQLNKILQLIGYDARVGGKPVGASSALITAPRVQRSAPTRSPSEEQEITVTASPDRIKFLKARKPDTRHRSDKEQFQSEKIPLLNDPQDPLWKPYLKSYPRLFPPHPGFLGPRYESDGGRKMISSGKKDPGGPSYGYDQLSSAKGTVGDFIKSEQGRKYARFFKDSKPGTAEFNNIYKRIDNRWPNQFAKDQHNFIKDTHYAPLANIAKARGFDLTNPIIREAIWSTSVQHRRRGADIISAVADADKDGSVRRNALNTIQALYEQREKAKPNDWRRYVAESAQALEYARMYEASRKSNGRYRWYEP